MGRVVLGVALAGLAVLVVAALGRDLRVVESALQDARSSLLAARASLADGDVDAATTALEEARRSGGVANTRINRLGWRIAERVPVAGRTLRSASGIVRVADETARLGGQVVAGAREVVGPDGGFAVQTRDGRVPLGPLAQARAALTDVRTDHLRDLVAQLRSVPTSLVPSRVAAAQLDTVSLAVEVADTLDGVRGLLDALPSLLGQDGPRRYFLAMQNPAELRGTGGLIGFFATVEVADGRMELSRPESYWVLEGLGQAPATAASDEFRRRYGSAGAAEFFGNVNADPDLPTVAPVMMDLYEQRTGQSVDGVLLVDPVGLSLLSQAVGPVDVPDGVAATAPGLPDPIAAEQLPRVTMIDVYDAFADRNAQRRAYLRSVATTAFDAIFDARWDGVAMAAQVGTAISRGHLAVHTRDEEVQEVLEGLDAAGALAPPEQDRDHLAVTANNVAGNKLDLHVAHRVTGTVTLTGGPDLTTVGRRFDLQVDVVNAFDPAGRADYLAGSFPMLALMQTPTPTGPRGLSRTWFSVWAPGDAEMQVDGQPTTTWSLHGHSVADRTVEAASGDTVGFRASGSGTAPVTAVGPTRRYVLEYRWQPKGIPDRLDLTVTAPDGWRVASADATGGGAGGGGGPDGEPGPAVTADVVDGVAHVTGDASADVVVVVDLVRGERAPAAPSTP